MKQLLAKAGYEDIFLMRDLRGMPIVGQLLHSVDLQFPRL